MNNKQFDEFLLSAKEPIPDLSHLNARILEAIEKEPEFSSTLATVINIKMMVAASLIIALGVGIGFGCQGSFLNEQAQCSSLSMEGNIRL